MSTHILAIAAIPEKANKVLSMPSKYNTMQKNILLMACLAIYSIAFTACANNTNSKTEVTSDKPGKCPKCGMDLVKKSDLVKDSSMQSMKMDGTMKDMKMDSTKH